MLGNFSRQSGPIGAFIFLAHIAKKILVDGDWIFVPIPLALETHVIGVGIQQCHAAMLGNPIKLAFPNVYVLFAKNPEKSEILNQRVRKLHIAASVRTRHPEWKDGARAIRFGFKRIRIKGGGVIFHVQDMQPLQFVLHQRRTKPGRIPLLADIP